MKQPETKIFDSMTLEQYEKSLAKADSGVVSIKCETKLDISQKAIDMISKAVLFKVTKRNTLVHLFNFKQEDGVFKFEVSAFLPKSFEQVYGKLSPKAIVATTFVDFCWLVGEGTTAKTAIEVSTPFMEGSILGDLTYLIPSKFADDLIEAMHSLNVEFFEGILSDTIMYGPFFFYKD